MKNNSSSRRWHAFKSKIKEKWNQLIRNEPKQKQIEEDIKRFESTLEGEKGQKMAHEYYHRDEDLKVASPKKLRANHVEGLNKKTEKFEKGYFNRDEKDDYPKRKAR